jgi:hypothetical protein
MVSLVVIRGSLEERKQNAIIVDAPSPSRIGRMIRSWITKCASRSNNRCATVRNVPTNNVPVGKKKSMERPVAYGFRTSYCSMNAIP